MRDFQKDDLLIGATLFLVHFSNSAKDNSGLLYAHSITTALT
jgi:hypothetical protein